MRSLTGKPTYFMVELPNNEILNINANCILKLIYEYIRLKAGVPDSLEMDLCDDDGVAKSLFEAPEGAYGTDFFEHRHMYYIVVLKRTKNGTVSNPRVLLSTGHRHFGHVMRAMAKVYDRISDSEFSMGGPKMETSSSKDKSKRKHSRRK
ncbi:hypothetical protein GE061_011885 [Apolygus lucorum]|uniref:Uncharacterized protein n=1 Tax=Apolygus lucorum TaxID=248454 RepID=A0A8S9XR06_APOLU|nr:hypothetical protein GE061_011885 [Apolygus lucorum]